MLRKYKKEDTDQIIEVFYNSAKKAYHFLDNTFFEEEKKNIEEIYLPNTVTYVYEVENQIAGFVSMIENEIGGLFVDPKYQGLKIGKALVDFVVEQKGEIILDVLAKNQQGRKFYDRYGFVEYERYDYERLNEEMIKMKYSKKK